LETTDFSPSDGEWEWEWACEYGGESHRFPSDWIFGGADGSDPRADVRWQPTTYYYYSDRLDVVATTQTPLCDDQAIDEFTRVARWSNPKYLAVLRPGETKSIMLPFEYTKADDTVREVAREQPSGN
jgi:hypothetical protein